MPVAQDVLNVMQAELGTTETGNNNNKYGIEYGLNNQPWCVIFQWYGFKHAGASHLFYGGGKCASCSMLFKYHKDRGQQIPLSDLQPGDIVFFDFSGKKKSTDHIGIIESRINSSEFYTFEGNTSSGNSGSQANGDGVYRRRRNLSQISCAYRPLYDGVSTGATGYKNTTGYSNDSFVRDVQRACGLTGKSIDGIVGPETRGVLPLVTIKENSNHLVVSTLQVRLFALGYKLPTYGADGDYGEETKNAIIEFQKDHGLEADGECGPKTWECILSI